MYQKLPSIVVRAMNKARKENQVCKVAGWCQAYISTRHRQGRQSEDNKFCEQRLRNYVEGTGVWSKVDELLDLKKIGVTDGKATTLQDTDR